MSKIKVNIKNRRIGKEVLVGGSYLPVVFPYGLSPTHSNIDIELKKIEIAETMGADMVKDNTIGRIEWEKLIYKVSKSTNLCVGASATIVAANIASSRKNMCYETPTKEDFYHAFEILTKYCDAIEVFPSITNDIIDKLYKSDRIFKHSVSRAGNIIIDYMKTRNEKNPFFSDWGWFVDYAKDEEITLILGNGLRAGCIKDSLDYLQMYEVKLFREFSRIAIDSGVGVIAGVIGHTDPTKTEILEKIRRNLDVPIGGLGPLITDTAIGYDHINAAIGIVVLRKYIDWVSLITPAEHIGLPSLEDVYQGMVAVNLARHIANIIGGDREAHERDRLISEKRANLNWKGMIELSIDPYLQRLNRKEGSPCSLCGRWCPIYHKISYKNGV